MRGRSFSNVVGDQIRHDPVAPCGGAPAHDDGEQRPSIAMDRGQEIETGPSRVAGLDSVDAVDAAEEMIVAADDLAVEVELGGREITEVAREALLERTSEDRQIMRRGDLLRRWEVRRR